MSTNGLHPWALLGKYCLHQQLDEGHFASVWLAAAVDVAASGKQAGVVLKVTEQTKASHAAVAANELAALRHLHSPELRRESLCQGAHAGGQHISRAHDEQRPATTSPYTADQPGSMNTQALNPLETSNGQPCITSGSRIEGGCRGAAGTCSRSEAMPLHAAGPPGIVGMLDAFQHIAKGSGDNGRQHRVFSCLALQQLGMAATDVLQRWLQGRPAGHTGLIHAPAEADSAGMPLDTASTASAPCNTHAAAKKLKPNTSSSSTAAEAARAAGRQEGEGPRGPRRRARRRGPTGLDGLPPGAVRAFAHDMLTCLDFMHRHASLVHNDIKPANIMLGWGCSAMAPPTPAMAVDTHHTGGGDTAVQGPAPAPTAAAPQRRWWLVDFGNCCALPSATQRLQSLPRGVWPCRGQRPTAAPHAHASASQAGGGPCFYDTPSYAAPELALGLPPSPASDMWALGCSVFEVATGAKLFPMPPALLAAGACAQAQAGDELSACEYHLALVVQLLGRLPRQMLHSAPGGWDFFDSHGRLLLDEEYQQLPPCPLRKRLGLLPPMSHRHRPLTGSEVGFADGCDHGDGGTQSVLQRQGCDGEWDEREVEGLYSFLEPLLRWDPGERLSAARALEHPWLQGGA